MKLSVVTTLFNSEKYIDEFHRRTAEAVRRITTDYEIVFVNDGSSDNSLRRVLELQTSDPGVVAIDLSRNFGHHRALMTGLQNALGDFIFLIDSDLEEAPELLNLFWETMSGDGDLDVVYGVQEKRKGTLLEQWSGSLWYWLFSVLSDIDYPANTLTARLMSKRYCQNLIRFTETELEIWGIFSLNGFNQMAVSVSKGDKGTSSYTLGKKVVMAIDSITSFSNKPLVFLVLFGLLLSCISGLHIVYLVAQWLAYDKIVEGWTSTLFQSGLSAA